MLKFNLKKLGAETPFENLNTSHVKVQLKMHLLGLELLLNLNTSHVKVQH